MDIQGSLPLIVVLVVAGFLLGNIFAAKPREREVRTSDFRTLARRLGFNPKLIRCPDWLFGTVQEEGCTNSHAVKHELVTVYAVICDEWRLPLVRLIVADGVWQVINGDHVLDGMSIAPPKNIKDHVLALQAKANSVMLYWYDGRYQSWQGAKKLDKTLAEQDLIALQVQLIAWGDEMNKKQSNTMR